MKPGPKKGFGKKQKYSMEELFQIWVLRKRCSNCGKLIDNAGFPLHQDFCGKTRRGGESSLYKALNLTRKRSEN